MNHFDEMTCLLYLDDQLDRDRALELATHAERCAACRALLRALERESRLLAESLVEEDEAVPARLLALPSREKTPWAWILSFGLAAAGAYTLWTGMVEPWETRLSQAGFDQNSVLTMLLFGGAFWKGWASMANAVQFLAVLTLGSVAFGLLRRRWRRRTTIAIVMAAVAFALILAPQAGAAELKKGDIYTLPQGSEVKNDLIVTAGTVRIDGTVDGDLIAFSQSVAVNGHVTGDVIAFTQNLRISGPVDGNVRCFSSETMLDGPVGKNISAFTGHFNLGSRATVGGSITAFSGNAGFEGKVNRDLLGFIGHTDLEGFLGGNARVRGERLTIGPSADVRGSIHYSGQRPPVISPGAKLASAPVVEIIHRRPDYASPRVYWRQALSWGAAFVFGLVVVLLVPAFYTDVVRRSRSYGPALGFGVLVLFATPILAIIACITIVGLAVGIGTVLLWLLALYASQVFVGTWVGENLLGPSTGTGAALGRLALGLLVLKAIFLIPYVAPWAKLLVCIWGLGAIVLALYHRARRVPIAAAA